MGSIPGMQGWFNTQKSINVLYHINRIKDTNHTIFSIKEKKGFDEIQHPFMNKNSQKLGIKEKYLNIMKTINEKLTTNITLNGEKP